MAILDITKVFSDQQAMGYFCPTCKGELEELQPVVPDSVKSSDRSIKEAGIALRCRQCSDEFTLKRSNLAS